MPKIGGKYKREELFSVYTSYLAIGYAIIFVTLFVNVIIIIIVSVTDIASSTWF